MVSCTCPPSKDKEVLDVPQKGVTICPAAMGEGKCISENPTCMHGEENIVPVEEERKRCCSDVDCQFSPKTANATGKYRNVICNKLWISLKIHV